ncbi:hypothetical protein R3P38DRAFT_1745544 [Favolaschia claudopus]|uniref:Secreted protein n=1 Tax=Favolaschia claudopus TaxID=2862362 RepID=A0AAW0DHM7_9AGAR
MRTHAQRLTKATALIPSFLRFVNSVLLLARVASVWHSGSSTSRCKDWSTCAHGRSNVYPLRSLQVNRPWISFCLLPSHRGWMPNASDRRVPSFVCSSSKFCSHTTSPFVSGERLAPFQHLD